ncbi:MAG: hypothetical protein QXF12_07665 [Candidatus Aenigmatarchaeota archaeon]
MLKSKNKFERFEAYAILGLVGFSLILTVGIGLTGVSTKGIPAIMSMIGALGSFLSAVFLIGVWVWEETTKE